MNTNELRRGNLVAVTQQEKTYYCIVDIIEEKRICVDWPAPEFYGMGMLAGWVDAEMVSGIPVTEEWLRRFGFIDSQVPAFDPPFLFHSDLPICWDNGFWKWNNAPFLPSGRQALIPKPNQIHQLMNLFFALTGEELTIKPKP